MSQINPPYDGSASCPMCPMEVRGISAILHNFLVRWPNGQSFVKLNDLRNFHRPREVHTDNPVVKEMLEAAALLCEAVAGMKEEGLQLSWTADIRDRVAALEPRVRAAEHAVRGLVDEHFRDSRHSHGQPNVLREQRGSRQDLYHVYTEYNYTVNVAPAVDADLVHTICGTGLRIHEHFRNEILRDPAFYGLVFCPTCSLNAPWMQWENRVESQACLSTQSE